MKTRQQYLKHKHRNNKPMKTINVEPQYMTMIKSGSHAVISGKYTPGEIYMFKSGGEEVKVRCTSWFGASEIAASSSFIKSL